MQNRNIKNKADEWLNERNAAIKTAAYLVETFKTDCDCLFVRR